MIGTEARGAWKELERKLRPYLARRAASPADIDDLLQDIFVRLHRSLPSLQDEERFGSWVYRVANSVIVDRARERARSPRAVAADVGDVSVPVDAGDEQLQRDLTQCVAVFVSQLPSPYREAIALTELEGMTQKATAEMLGISLSGLKSRVQRGREKIRVMFDECCRISVDCRGHVVECEPRGGAESPSCGGIAGLVKPDSA